MLASARHLDSRATAAGRALCVGNTADSERSDKHGDDDQFLYHFGVLLQRLVRIGGFGLYHRSRRVTIAKSRIAKSRKR